MQVGRGLFCVTRTGVSTTPFRAHKTHAYAETLKTLHAVATTHGVLTDERVNTYGLTPAPVLLTLVAPIGQTYCAPGLPAPYDQQSIGACVWEATVGAIHIKSQTATNAEGVHLSVTCGYYFDRCFQGSPTEDCGSDSQNAMYIVQTNGVCLNKTLPFVNAIINADGDPIAPPYPDGIREAANHKLPGADWAACGTPKDVEVALKTGDGRTTVIFGSEVSSDILAYTQGQILSAPNMEDIQGGHEMLVVGVQYGWSSLPAFVPPDAKAPTGFVEGKRYWWIRNSWSVDYGYNGYILCDDAFLFNDTALGSHFALLSV